MRLSFPIFLWPITGGQKIACKNIQVSGSLSMANTCKTDIAVHSAINATVAAHVAGLITHDEFANDLRNVANATQQYTDGIISRHELALAIASIAAYGAE